MKNKLRTVIIEDEMVSRMILENYCRNHPDIELVKDFDDIPSAVDFLKKEHADLILLDIQLKNSFGFDILNHLKNSTQIIVTTSSKEYIEKAKKLGLENCLLKPISLQDFLWSVKKLKQPTTEII